MLLFLTHTRKNENKRVYTDRDPISACELVVCVLMMCDNRPYNFVRDFVRICFGAFSLAVLHFEDKRFGSRFLSLSFAGQTGEGHKNSLTSDIFDAFVIVSRNKLLCDLKRQLCVKLSTKF